MHWTAPRTAYRPAVARAQRLLRGEMATAVLAAVLAELRASSGWIVLEPFDAPPERLVQVVYQPRRTPYGFRAVPVAPDVWRFMD